MFNRKIKSFIATFIFCFITWIILTLSFDKQEIIAGILVSIIVALFSNKYFIHEDAFYLFNPIRFLNVILYIPLFIKELIKANIDVTKRILNPKLNINPGIIKVPCELKSEYGLAMLCNSITLTPGTISMDVVEEEGKNYIYIHWIDVQSKGSKEAGDMIKGSLEAGVRRIWE